jgi:hypothetical protein
MGHFEDHFSGLSKAKIAATIICLLYNKLKRGMLSKAASPEDVMEVLNGIDVKGVNKEDVIKIAKALCKGAKYICPYVDKL